MNTTDTTESTDKAEPGQGSEQETIARISYFIWLCEGCPEGCSEEHWRQAEALHAKNGEPAPSLENAS